MNNQQHDDTLWQIAKRRAAFKASLNSYIVVNILLVGIWYFSSGINSYFWPIWPILGWGFGIGMQYVSAYNKSNYFSAEQEYEKLKNEQTKDI